MGNLKYGIKNIENPVLINKGGSNIFFVLTGLVEERILIKNTREAIASATIVLIIIIFEDQPFVVFYHCYDNNIIACDLTEIQN